MFIYLDRRHSASPWHDPHYLLTYSTERISEDPATLETWVIKLFRVVFAGGELDFGETWDRCLLAAEAGGLAQSVAQQRIGQAVAHARRDGVAA